MRRKLVDYARMFEVSAFVPSEGIRNAARERTEGLVNYFRIAAREMGAHEYENAVDTLARSCYIQGAQDAAKVAAEMRKKEQA